VDKTKLLKEHKMIYIKELNRVLSFWQTYGYDIENSGFYTFLDQEGNIYSKDKSVWAQGRAVYIFSQAYKNIRQDEKWLEMAISTYRFIQNNCFDKDGKMYFSITDEGLGIQKRRYWFSEAFYLMAAISLYEVTEELSYLEDARRTYDFITSRYYNPELTEPKYNRAVLNVRDLASSMILLSLSQLMLKLDKDYSSNYQRDLDFTIMIITDHHYHPEKEALMEFVNVDGSLHDSLKGRLVNPGHALECSWFLLESSTDKVIYEKSKNIAKWSYKKGWDKDIGGIKYFTDIEDKPLEQLEHDLKLWWPHCEALITFLKLYLKEESNEMFDIYKQVFDFTFSKFIVDDYEWLGYLHYDNTPSTLLKGNMFKGPFHIPRMLMMNYLSLDKYLKEKGE
jgi:N-acylglucosamine 2-epimerase